jgi:hypothetical protein
MARARSHLNRLLAALQVTDEAHHAPLAGTTCLTTQPLSGVEDFCQDLYQQLLIIKIL